MRGPWTTERLSKLEVLVIDLTYMQGFLHLVVNEDMPTAAAIQWLYFWGSKHPQSRLAGHLRLPRPTLDQFGD